MPEFLAPVFPKYAWRDSWMLFFFQAKDGIRDSSVTGVQTCALPISKFTHHLKVRLRPAMSWCRNVRTRSGVRRGDRLSRLLCVTTELFDGRPAWAHRQCRRRKF